MANQREIAKALGLAQATVSLAMRGHPSIPAKTQELVWETAKKLGYRPNPMVAALMESIRSGRPVKDQGCLAILYDKDSRDPFLQKLSAYRIQLEGMQNQAILRGYRSECFYLHNPGVTAEALDRQLYSRGIAGVILAAPKSVDSPAVRMQWDRYAASTISYTWQVPAVDRVSSHHRHNVDLAFQKVLERGYLRIGMCLPAAACNGVDSNWLAGYLVCESHLPARRRIPLFKGTIHDTPTEKFRAWHERWKPDVILSLMGEETHWLKQIGIPREAMRIVCLNLQPGSPLSGIVENNYDVGAAATDIVVQKLNHNERGLPAHPRLLLIDGSWKEGNSLPAAH
ncbi:LacI family transcriptional regulator [Verrucomicrobia bacterium LW23]|nr:LacI family transcriptional regulator [Verrucomicrobia bacterium LW23]